MDTSADTSFEVTVEAHPVQQASDEVAASSNPEVSSLTNGDMSTAAKDVRANNAAGLGATGHVESTSQVAQGLASYCDPTMGIADSDMSGYSAADLGAGLSTQLDGAISSMWEDVSPGTVLREHAMRCFVIHTATVDW